jgi:putative endonuclease
MYILECSDKSLYTGSTINLEKRLWEHQNSIGAVYTRKRLPVKLAYCEEFSRIDEAFAREIQVKGWSHGKKLALIEQNWETVKQLAGCFNESNSKDFDSGLSSPDVKSTVH